MKKSNCCDANIIEETDLCSQCKEHCEAIDEELSWLLPDWQPTEVIHYTNKG